MMAIKKKYKTGGTTSKKMGGKKQLGGIQSPRPAASFIEPPMEQPFAQDSFVAQRGGVRKLRKEQRQDRRAKRKADRQADRQARQTLKRSSKLKRQDKLSDAGEDISMSRSDRRADRRATNKASRIFKRQERKARRTTNKADRIEDRTERQTLKATNKKKKQDAIDAKLKILNQSESSSVKTPPVVKKEEVKKVDVKKEEVKKKQTFSQAYRTNRDAGEKTFMHNGKKYTTESRSEKAARLKTKKKKPVVKKGEKIKVVKGGPNDIDGDGINDNIQGTTSQNRPKVTPTKKKVIGKSSTARYRKLNVRKRGGGMRSIMRRGSRR